MGERVLVLRTCNSDMTSSFGFRWPDSGYVEAPDWKPTYECGNGLHGLLWGVGSNTYLSSDRDARWLVIEVDGDDLLTGKGDLRDKCKFARGQVVHVGDYATAVKYIREHGGAEKKIVAEPPYYDEDDDEDDDWDEDDWDEDEDEEWDEDDEWEDELDDWDDDEDDEEDDEATVDYFTDNFPPRDSSS